MNTVIKILNTLFKRKVTHEERLRELRAYGMIIGEQCSISSDAEFEEAWATHIRIGNEVTISRGVRFISHDASMWRELGASRVGVIEIGDRAFIGAYSIVMPNVRIGSDVIVGSGSVVTKNIPDGVVVGGNPARNICTTAELLEKTKNKLASVPRFGEEYRSKRGGTVAMRQIMRTEMPEGEAFIVFEGAARGLKPPVET